jgi:putative PIN family toxin of toxin-antitoxin system
VKELKLVIDANILVSAYCFGGRIQEKWKAGLGCHKLIISPEIIAEVERTLRQAEFHLESEEIRVRLKDILDCCEVVRPKVKYQGRMPDEKDRHLVNLALEVRADRIITGDTALLTASPIAGIQVLKLRDSIKESSS